MLDEKINNIKVSFESEIEKVKNSKQLEDARIKYLSRNGLIANLFEELKTVPKEDKPLFGKELNSLRASVTDKFNSIKEKIESDSASVESEIDLTLPGIPVQIGRKHLLTQWD